MPWCEACERYLTPQVLTPAGECPSCRAQIVAEPRAPWHFKLLVGMAAAYLGWRTVQGLAWVVGRL